MERWAELGEPTPLARIAEAKAFVDLRLVDRAWSRLRDLVEAPEPHREAVVVAIELFLLREWHERARKLVAWAVAKDPADPVLRALQARAQEPATTVEPPSVDPDDLTIAEIVYAAEQHMAHGAFIKARSMLERARRRSPDHPRVQDLLWALDGEFSVPVPLEALVRRLSAVLADVGDETEQTEFIEHTRPLERPPLTPTPAEPRFSQLFRREPHDPSASPSPRDPARFEPADAPGQRTLADDELSAPFGQRRPVPVPRATSPAGASSPRSAPSRAERGDQTAVSSLADVERRRPGSERRAETTDPAEGTDGGDDTQIARIVRRTAQSVPIAPAHALGSSASPSLARERALAGEAEDDSVVVHTRHVQPGDPLEGPRPSFDPLRAAQAEASRERLANRWRREDNAWAITQPRRHVPPPPVRRPSSTEATERIDWEDAPARGRRAIIAAVVIAAIGSLLLVTALAVWLAVLAVANGSPGG